MYAIKIKGVWQLKSKIPSASSWAHNDPYAKNKVAIHTEPPYDFTTQKLGKLIVDEINLTSTKEVINFSEDEIITKQLVFSSTLSQAQLRKQLDEIGLPIEAIIAHIEALPSDEVDAVTKKRILIDLNWTTEFQRSSGSIKLLWEKLGKTPEELDMFFINAFKL